MSTVEEILALTAALAGAGYPVALAPATPAIRPCVTVEPPTITPVSGACTGPRQLVLAARVTGAGAVSEQVLDLVQAVDDVLAAVPADWNAAAAAPTDSASEDPAYAITLSKETTWP